jgi:hypothetical protein
VSSAILDQHCADVGRGIRAKSGGRDTWGWASTNYARPRTTVDAHVKVGVTDFLLILHGDHPTVAGEHLAALLPALRELG